MMPFNDPLKILRDRGTPTSAFRRAARRVAASLARRMKAQLRKRGAEGPVTLVIILRSGIALLEPAMRAFPGARTGVLGLKRDEKTFEPHWYYENLPPLSKEDTVVILDPMLATGGSAEAAALRLAQRGAEPSRMYFLGVVGAPEGLERLSRAIPKENIVLAALDQGLDAKKYIVPGVGDFGDRYFGYDETAQSA